MDGDIGQIGLFAGHFEPYGWRFCDGRLLNIAQNTALFSIIGTTYGGDGSTTFGLPDLRGRVPLGVGQGPKLSDVTLGQLGGSERYEAALTAGQMAAHSHSFNVANDNADTSPASNSTLLAAKASDSVPLPINFYRSYKTGDAVTTLHSAAIGPAGKPSPDPLKIETRSPFCGMNYIICVQGLFPQRW